MQSPSAPRDYVSALAQQFPLNERTAGDSRPALAICDWGLQSAVKTAVACHRAGVDHLLGLRLRVVPEAAKRTFFWRFHQEFRRAREDRADAVLARSAETSPLDASSSASPTLVQAARICLNSSLCGRLLRGPS